MKNLFTSLVVLLIGISSFAQITLENDYAFDLKHSVLNNGDVLYYYNNKASRNIEVYKNDHTLLKTIDLSNFYSPITESSEGTVYLVQLSHLSDRLFDTDAGLELIISTRVITKYAYPGISDVYKWEERNLYVINDDGSVLLNQKLKKDSINMNSYLSIEAEVVKDGAISKLLIKEGVAYDFNTKVYSLPGNLQTIVSLDDKVIDSQLKPSAFPNPAIEYTKIAYTLPEGQKEAELVIYDATGKEIQRSKVGSMFNDILVNTSSFQEGTYIYNLVTNHSSSLQGKFVVMK